MSASALSILSLGGPTALLNYGGLRLVVDPTFDAPGDHPVGSRVLTKTMAAVLGPDEIGPVDAVLLSHDQHPDNLDSLGREYLGTVPLVLSTASAEERLGGVVRALPNREHIELPRPDGGTLRITGVPAQHGPDGTEHLVGEVTGFVLTGEGLPTVYISGDNASLDIVTAVAERFGSVDIALLFAGAVRTRLFDGALLTLDSAQTAEAASVLGVRPPSLCTSTPGCTSRRAPPICGPRSNARAWRTDWCFSAPGSRRQSEGANARMVPASPTRRGRGGSLAVGVEQPVTLPRYVAGGRAVADAAGPLARGVVAVAGAGCACRPGLSPRCQFAYQARRFEPTGHPPPPGAAAPSVVWKRGAGATQAAGA